MSESIKHKFCASKSATCAIISMGVGGFCPVLSFGSLGGSFSFLNRLIILPLSVVHQPLFNLYSAFLGFVRTSRTFV